MGHGLNIFLDVYINNNTQDMDDANMHRINNKAYNTIYIRLEFFVTQHFKFDRGNSFSEQKEVLKHKHLSNQHQQKHNHFNMGDTKVGLCSECCQSRSSFRGNLTAKERISKVVIHWQKL